MMDNIKHGQEILKNVSAHIAMLSEGCKVPIQEIPDLRPKS